MLEVHVSFFLIVPTSAPRHPSGYAISSSSIYLTWDPPPLLERHGIIREYQINLTERETGTLTTYTTSSTFIEVSLLHPFYNYSWVVTAITIGEGPYTASSAVMTLEDGKLRLLANLKHVCPLYSSKWSTAQLHYK